MKSTFSGISLLFILLLIVVGMNSHAQSVSPIFNDEDTAALGEAMLPMPSDVQLSDAERQAVTDSLKKMGYSFQRFKDVLVLKKDIFWGDIIYSRIEAFYDSTYISIHNIPEVNDRGILIVITNRFGSLLEESELDPYVKIQWKMHPVISGKPPYKLEVNLLNSSSIPDMVSDSIEVRMNHVFYQKLYSSVYESEEDIEEAIEICLNELGEYFGTSLAPKYLIRINNKDMVSGMVFQAFPGEGADTLVAIDIIDRTTGEVTMNEIVWENVYPDQRGGRAFSTSRIGEKEVKAMLADDTLVCRVKVISNEPRDMLMSLFMSFIYEAIDVLLTTVENDLRARQSDAESIKTELQREYEAIINNRQNVRMGNQSSGSSTLVFLDGNETTSSVPAPALGDQPEIGEYKYRAERYERMIHTIEFLHANKQYLVALTQGDNFTTFKNDLHQDIGRMNANLLYNLINGGSEEAKNYLVQFIAQKMISSSSAR